MTNLVDDDLLYAHLPKCPHCHTVWHKHESTESLCAKLLAAKTAIRMLLELPMPPNSERVLHAQKVLTL